MGSLLTAVASYLHARSQQGTWLLRIDDLDQARNMAGADSLILRQLEAHGLNWDEPPRRQTEHLDEYLQAIEHLRGLGLLYPCNCTRRRLATLAKNGTGAIYDGHCLAHPPQTGAVSWRVRVCGQLQFNDGWQGMQQVDLASEAGDFIVRRADQVTAYQLACAVDEAAQRITEVVRGIDLLESTCLQIFLQEKLGLAPAPYRHLPILVDASGRKLSKQNHAAALDQAAAPQNLLRCLRWLGQRPPPELALETPEKILNWAQSCWSEQDVPRSAAIQLE